MTIERQRHIHRWVLQHHSPAVCACAYIRAISIVQVDKNEAYLPESVKRQYPKCWSDENPHKTSLKKITKKFLNIGG